MTGDVFLGIETSGEYTALALLREGTVIAGAAELTPAKHNERIFALLDQLFGQASAEPSELAGIGIAIGPGMFTSLRVGLSVAKGLAMARAIPLKGINTLDAMVHTTIAGKEANEQLLIPIIDARKGEVYCARYQGATRQSDYLVLAPHELLALAPGQVALCASPSLPCRSELEAGFGPRAVFVAVDHPAPEIVAALARQAIGAGQADDFATISPLYLRRTDAELRRDAAASAQP